MNKNLALLALAFVASLTCASAQEPTTTLAADTVPAGNTTPDFVTQADMQALLDDMKRQERVWGKRKYLNLSYVRQTLTYKDTDLDYESKWGVAFTKGTTYYLHSKPIGGVLKIGLDWTQADVNYVNYQIPKALKPYTEDSKIGVHQVDLAMHIGPSATVNPIDYLKISAYFRFAPSMSFIVNDADGETKGHYNFVPFFVTGASLAYKRFAIGYEWRWGSAKYSSFKREDDEEAINTAIGSNGSVSVDDLLSFSKSRLRTSSSRLYLSLRL